MSTQKLPVEFVNKYILLAAAVSGAAVGVARVKWPLSLAGGFMALIAFLMAPEVLGFFIGGGLQLTGRTLELGLSGLHFLNTGSFLFPLYCLLLFLLLKKRAGTLIPLLKCWEAWAALGLGLLMLLRLPGSLFAEYGAQKLKYYLANNMVSFAGPVLATAVWDLAGLHRFLKGLFLGGLALTAYFWLSKAFLDLPFNAYAVLNFNPIGLGRLIGLFALLAVTGRMMPFPGPLRLSLAAAAGAAVVLLNARGPALALVAALLFGCLPAGGRFRPQAFLAVISFCLVAFYIVSNYWFSTGFLSAGDSGRLQLYQAALNEFLQNPLLGAGTGSFAGLAPLPGVMYPHNLFLESAVEMGLTGLGLSLLLAFTPLARLITRTKRSEDMALAGPLLVYCLVNAMISGDIPGNFPLWLSAGVAAALFMAEAEGRRCGC